MTFSSRIISSIILLLLSIPIMAQKQEDAANDTTLLRTDLKLPGIEVTAQRRLASNATSYIMGRMTLDHAQVLNLSDIMSLLPGGKTVNSTLMDDSRFALHAGSGERGNAAFGTAIEVDGMRLDNNAMMDEVLSASTRNISSSNIGSVEVITGVASVEYGDVSNGIVKVNPRKGVSQWILEGSLNPYTRQVALNKGFSLGNRHHTLNISIEHAQSFSNTASPYTSYKRNILSIGYDNFINITYKGAPHSQLTIHAALTGNIGGNNSEADPDAFKDTYTKIRDNQLRGTMDLSWIRNTGHSQVWKVSLHGAFSTSDKRSESNTNVSSSSSQAYLHTMTDGYAIAQDYTTGSQVGGIILSPTGYWYVHKYIDQKPLTSSLKAKGEWTAQLPSIHGGANKLMLGIERNTSRNNGEGEYYESLQYAPTWRPYVYRDLPTLTNTSIFAEEKFTLKKLQLTAGLRDDVTSIPGSEYGTVSSYSPRFNARYLFARKGEFGGASIRIGWGKSVKLPSFQVLYPADAYSDKLTFTPGSTTDNKAYYAYYTQVQKALYNPDIKWQYANQLDLGFDITWHGFKFSASAFWTKTYNPYQMVNIYTPFSYNYTDNTSLNNIGIASSDRQYSVDSQTGVVTVSSLSGAPSVTLPYTTYNTYTTNHQYVNGSPVTRYGIEWIIDMPLVNNHHLVGMTLRLDGSYYHYKGIDQSLIAGSPNGVGDVESSSDNSYPLIGWYNGSSISSASSPSTPTVSNGILSKGCNVNATLTARIPKAGLIMTLKVESTFLNYKRSLAENNNAILLEAAGDVFGTAYNGEEDHYVAVYPAYYSTWQNPDIQIPFAQALAEAKTTDPSLYNALCKLIVRSNTSYYFNPASISSYFSCNFSISKDIGRHVSLSFYANNFLNNMSLVRNTQTNLESSLFNSGYIPKFYYGMSVRLKL